MIDEKKLIEELNRQKYILTFEDSNPIDEGFNCGIDKAIQLVESQPKVGEWIPVEERLPEKSLNSVIGWDTYRECCVFVQYYMNEWILGSHESVNIVAWRPVPEPYEVKENERP